jgi:hypothetical protein
MKFRNAAVAVATAAAALTVAAAPADAATAAKTNPTLSISASTRWAHYGDTVTLTAHLGKTAANRTVTIYRSPAGETSNQVVKTGKVDRYGNLRASVWLGRNTSFSVKFTGDAKDNAATRSVYVHDAAVVHQWMTQGTYANGQAPAIEGYVSGNRQVTIYPHLQIFAQGAWRTVDMSPTNFLTGTTGKFKITSNGLWAGYSYRQTVNFNGDSLNDGSGYHWTYFKISK